MLQLMFAALLALAVMQGANPNPIPVQCVSTEALQEGLGADLPQARVLAVPENRVAEFVAAFNALPPRTDAEADAVLIVVMPDAPKAVIAFFWEGCLVGRTSLPAPLLEGLMGTIAVEA
jgi:hypothetical protein